MHVPTVFSLGRRSGAIVGMGASHTQRREDPLNGQDTLEGAVLEVITSGLTGIQHLPEFGQVSPLLLACHVAPGRVRNEVARVTPVLQEESILEA